MRATTMIEGRRDRTWMRVRFIAAGVALIALLAPSTPAVAAANATAGLVNGNEVAPDQTRMFSLRIASQEPAGPLGSGRTINLIDVILPVETAGIRFSDQTISPPAGWNLATLDRGSLQRMRLTPAGSGLAPASSLTFNFPAHIDDTPVDRIGRIEVSVSSDRGLSTKRAIPTPAGSTTVRVVVPKPATPTITQVTRNTGTEPAYRDASEDRYYTRFGDSDLEATVTGGAVGDNVQVLDQAGNVLSSSAPLTTTGPARVQIPLGSTDHVYHARSGS